MTQPLHRERRIPRPAIWATAKRALGPAPRTRLDRGHRQGLRPRKGLRERHLRSGAHPDWPRGGVGGGGRARVPRGNRHRAPGAKAREDRRAGAGARGREDSQRPGNEPAPSPA